MENQHLRSSGKWWGEDTKHITQLTPICEKGQITIKTFFSRYTPSRSAFTPVLLWEESVEVLGEFSPSNDLNHPLPKVLHMDGFLTVAFEQVHHAEVGLRAKLAATLGEERFCLFVPSAVNCTRAGAVVEGGV